MLSIVLSGPPISVTLLIILSSIVLLLSLNPEGVESISVFILGLVHVAYIASYF